VGGLFANMRDKVGFYQDNMLFNMNVLRACNEFGVQRAVSALSTCVFPDQYRPEGQPKDENYVMKEEDINKGPPHPSN
jgi:GDP-L-fucose synthase